jgi:MYND finger
MQAQVCCFNCGKLQRPMGQCQKCGYARFCSRACQQAVWPGRPQGVMQEDFADEPEADSRAEMANSTRTAIT